VSAVGICAADSRQPAPIENKPIWLLALGLIAAIYFYLAPVMQVSDAQFTVALSERLLYAHSLDLKPVIDASPAHVLPFQDANGDLPLHTVRIGDRVFYAYPIWTSVLISPLVWLLNGAGLHALDPLTGAYVPAGEFKAQRIIAALLAALLIMVLMRLALALTTPKRALALALLLIVASSVSSTLSRALWAQSAATLMLALALLHVVSRWQQQRAVAAAWLVGSLTLMVLLRQPLLFSALLIGLGVALDPLNNRRALVLWTLLFGAAALAFHFIAFAQITPPSRYGPSLFTLERAPQRLFSLCFAASRGMAIYLPLAVVAMLAALFCRFGTMERRWRTLALLAITAHLLLLAFYKPWAGGGAYGPRLLAELTPWWLLLAALALGQRPLRAALLAALAVLALWQTFIHVRGSFSQATFEWNNVEPTYVAGRANFHGWRYPQFLAGWRDRPYPPVNATPLAVLEATANFTDPSSDPFVHSDFGPAAANGRALSGPFPQLRFAFPAAPTGSERLTLDLSSSKPAEISVFLNDQKVQHGAVSGFTQLPLHGEYRRGNMRNNALRIDCVRGCAELRLLALNLTPQ